MSLKILMVGRHRSSSFLLDELFYYPHTGQIFLLSNYKPNLFKKIIVFGQIATFFMVVELTFFLLLPLTYTEIQ